MPRYGLEADTNRPGSGRRCAGCSHPRPALPSPTPAEAAAAEAAAAGARMRLREAQAPESGADGSNMAAPRLSREKSPGDLSFLQRSLEIAAAEQRFWKALYF